MLTLIPVRMRHPMRDWRFQVVSVRKSRPTTPGIPRGTERITRKGSTRDSNSSPLVTVGAALFSISIGVFFGLYPANKAARMDPVTALGRE